MRSDKERSRGSQARMQSGLKCVLFTKIRPLVKERPALVGGKSDSHCTRVLSAACVKDSKDTKTGYAKNTIQRGWKGPSFVWFMKQKKWTLAAGLKQLLQPF